MEFSLRRLKDIEDHLSKDFDLLREYEDELRFEDDPQRRAKFEHKIRQIKHQISLRQAELTGPLSEETLDETNPPLLRSAIETRTSNTLDDEEFQFSVSHLQSQTLTPTHSQGPQVRPITVTDDLLQTSLPPQQSNDFIGRRDHIDELLSVGENTVMIAVTGVLGIGKTALLTAVAARLDSSSLFWYEFNSGFTTLDDVLMRLARFLDNRSGNSRFT